MVLRGLARRDPSPHFGMDDIIISEYMSNALRIQRPPRFKSSQGTGGFISQDMLAEPLIIGQVTCSFQP